MCPPPKKKKKKKKKKEEEKKRTVIPYAYVSEGVLIMYKVFSGVTQHLSTFGDQSIIVLSSWSKNVLKIDGMTPSNHTVLLRFVCSYRIVMVLHHWCSKCSTSRAIAFCLPNIYKLKECSTCGLLNLRNDLWNCVPLLVLVIHTCINNT